MTNTADVETTVATRRGILGLAAVAGMDAAFAQADGIARRNTENTGNTSMTSISTGTLSSKTLSLGPMAAAAALGDMTALSKALDAGLDAGLTLSEAKEVLVQLYAYAGFPRSLNALTELMKVVDERRNAAFRIRPACRRSDPSR